MTGPEIAAAARRVARMIRHLQPADRDDLEQILALGVVRNPHAEPIGRMRGDAIDWLRRRTGVRSGAAAALRRPMQLPDEIDLRSGREPDPADAAQWAESDEILRAAAASLPGDLAGAGATLLALADGNQPESMDCIARRHNVVRRTWNFRLARARDRLRIAAKKCGVVC